MVGLTNRLAEYVGGDIFPHLQSRHVGFLPTFLKQTCVAPSPQYLEISEHFTELCTRL